MYTYVLINQTDPQKYANCAYPRKWVDLKKQYLNQQRKSNLTFHQTDPQKYANCAYPRKW